MLSNIMICLLFNIIISIPIAIFSQVLHLQVVFSCLKKDFINYTLMSQAHSNLNNTELHNSNPENKTGYRRHSTK